MFNTKLEVDRHVENCLRKINTELERNLRCFAFAKLYYKVGDYNSAHRYISSYLNVKSSSSEGQQLLGKIYEKLGKKAEALNAYKTSLDIDPKQNSLVLKVCELMASDDVNLDQTGAKYFCELAQSFDPYNPVLFQLKARLVALESKDPNEVTQLLLKELEARPLDVDIRVRLLRHLLQHKQIKEAYNHAYDIEKKYLSIFLNSLNWYETLAEVLVCYQRENSIGNTLTWEYWMLLISVLDKLVSLSLDERSISIKNNTEYVTAVLNFDQNLRIAVDKIKTCPEKQLIAEFINHYSGQLCLHFITLLFKYARKDLIKYKEAIQISMPLLFAAYSFKPSDLESIWFQHASEGYKQQVQRWHKEAAFRCSQVGHMIMSSDRRNSVLERAKQGATGLWREHAFKKIFVTRDHQLKLKTSFFTCSEQFVDFSIQLPDTTELVKYDNVAQLVFPGSLHHYIWIGLNQELTQFNCSAFNGLNYSIKNLNNCAAESLNVLDIQSFIYCSVLCAQAQIEENKHTIYYNMEKPSVLPVSVMSMLGTANQDKWLKCAYKMFSSNQYNSDLGDVRLTLIRGIEVVRCIGNHGLDVKLLICLAKIFEERANKLTKQSEIEFNDARAELYWKAALPLLEKLKRNQAVSYSTNRLFEYKIKELTQTEIPLNIEAAKLFMASQLMKRKEYEKALQIFETLKDPYASFHQSQIYKSLAEKETNLNKENVTSEMRSQQIILLTKARDYLYLTLDRLRNPNINKKHPLNSKLGTEIEKIERLLSRIDPDTCLNRNDECDEMSDENVSSYGSEQHYNHSYTNGMFIPRHENTNMHSTPFRDNTRREARPSPERLDAQLRQLAASKDAAINHILDQNKIMVESHKNLVDELKSFREAVSALTITVNDLKHIRSSVDDIKQIKVSVDELKVSVDELQNFKSVTDLVYEMRKEISELKKDTNKIKSNQLSDEDLYVLDEEYRTDYGSTSTNASSLASSIYPNYARMAPQNPSCPNPTMSYSNAGYYPPIYSMYPCGLPQAGALPFGAESQLPDIRAVAMNAAQSVMNPAVVAAAAAAYQHAPLHPQAAAPPITFPPSPLQQLHNQVLPQIFKETTIAPPAAPPVINTSAANKAAPVNVVITSSDPLPTIKTSSPQIFSVTIPPHHLKGNQQKPHNYQIQLPASTSTIVTTPSILSQSPMPVSTQSLLSNVAPPIFSALPDKSPNRNASLGFQIEKSLALSFNKSANDTILNRSNVSTSSQEEHDPCPDFKPIIPLPDEVPVNTGEENEEVLFCERAKLFRYVNKEWKERGVGELKLLKNPECGKIRLLMRRDQVHKICANHYLTEDMTLKQMSKNEQAYIWGANDFSEGEYIIEKFCVQFKTPELAKNFFKEFENAKKLIAKKVENKPADLGGFKFTSKPAFKPKEDNPVVTSTVSQADDKKTASPFAAFTFTKDKPTDSMKTFNFETNKNTFSFTKETPSKQDKSVTDSPIFSVPLVKNVQNETKLIKENANVSSIFGNSSSTFTPVKQTEQQSTDKDEGSAEDFVPTVEFQPVIPLPDLVEVKTGEEDAEVLFESKAKLLRFDTNTKEWKERGVGQMKILKEKNIRLVMRREQVHKVCCNHQLLKDMEFKMMKGSTKAVNWCAKDYSEGAFNTEMLAIRFKTEDITAKFLDVLKEAKEMLDDSNGVRLTDDDKAGKVAKQSEEKVKTTGFGDKFKPKTGTWECKNCYIVNDQKVNHCMACETPKNDTVPKKQTDSSQFCFGVGAKTTGFGDAFKPKTGSWECKSCYTRNDSTKTKCASCEIPKEGPSDSANTGSTFKSAVDLSTGGLSFSFGMPAATQKQTVVAKPVVTKGFGDAFKPKAGSWECKECYTISEGNYCLSCECPKDDTVPAKDKTSKSVNLDTGGLKFKFGIQPTTVATPTSTTTDTENKGFQFKPSNSNTKQADTTEEIVFGSPHKTGFDFTPRSPRRQSSGPGQEEEAENSYYEDEEDNIYFKPVIPLPDKVEVTTGEEDEDVLYCHRAKLFRHVDHEWKERGIGDLKILYNTKANKLRVLMRREQIHKICLNHILTDSIAYTSKDDKTWLFSANDYSEGSYEYQNFCLRFKTAEIAKQFKEAVDEALKKSSHGVEDEEDDEVEFVCETSVTAEEEAEALKLGLPPKFMSYRQLADCECSQCKEDDDILDSTPKKNNTTEFSTPNSTYFGTPSGDNNSFTTIVKPEKQGTTTLKELLSKPTIFGSSLIAAKSNVTTSTSSGIFGVSDEDNKSSPAKFFGGFSMNTTTAPSSTVFGTTTENIFSSTKTGPTTIFSNSPTTTLTNVFGTGSDQKTTSSVFGATTTTGSIFGGSAIFGSSAPPPTSFTNEKVFGNIAQSTTGKKVIGNGTAPTSGITFGTPTTSTMTGNLFGTPSTVTGSIFGGNSNVFGDKNTSTPTTTSTGSIFGGFGSTSTPPTTTNVFGTPSSTATGSVFGSSAVFNTSSSVFGTPPQTTASFSGNIFETNTASPATKSIFAGDNSSNLSFTSIIKEAANSSAPKTELLFSSMIGDKQTAAFVTSGNVDNPFARIGAGAPVFASQKKPTQNKNVQDETKDDEGAEGEEYDPYYAPIVPLPDAIVVTTGEENEEVLFTHKGKLYRFDNKEWKERGVGDVKVLHNPETRTYRLLLRREVVHKIVLNQRITSNLDMQPFSKSANTWMWAGYNYCDNETLSENLAVRFKDEKTYIRFYETVQKAIEEVKKVKSSASDVPTTIENISEVDNDEVDEEEDVEDEEVDEEEEEDDDDDEEDGRRVLFAKECALSEKLPSGEWVELSSMVHLQIIYDPERWISRIIAVDNTGCIHTNSVIKYTESSMRMEPDENGVICNWTSLDSDGENMIKRNLRATFDSNYNATDCYCAFEETFSYIHEK